MKATTIRSLAPMTRPMKGAGADLAVAVFFVAHPTRPEALTTAAVWAALRMKVRRVSPAEGGFEDEFINRYVKLLFAMGTTLSNFGCTNQELHRISCPARAFDQTG